MVFILRKQYYTILYCYTICYKATMYKVHAKNQYFQGTYSSETQTAIRFFAFSCTVQPRLLPPGSLLISDNPFRCGCHLAWLGHWLRRWLRESLQSHSAPVDTAVRLASMLREATCVDPGSGLRIPVVQLPPEDISCHASALSTAPGSSRTPVVLVWVAAALLRVCCAY